MAEELAAKDHKEKQKERERAFLRLKNLCFFYG
jgi:hypothetical protein